MVEVDTHAPRELEHVEIVPTVDALMHAAAERFVRRAANAIAASGRFAVALSGGSTPRALYTLLAGDPYRARVDWPRVHVFWSDERCVPPDDAASNYRLARESLLDHVAVPAVNIHRIKGEREPAMAAAAYELELRRFFEAESPASTVAGCRFDLMLLGMGGDGHTASLFPGTAAIHEKTRWVVAHHVEAVSAWRVTCTPVVINSASEIVFLVCGQDKARMLRRVIQGPYDPDAVPAQVVAPEGGELYWLIDAEAAMQLGKR